MSSGFSNLEKSMEECINYNFDNNSQDISKMRLNRSKNKGSLRNHKFTKWSDFKEKYPWLYMFKNNPNCTFCEQAFNENSEMVKTCWTNPEIPVEITDETLDEAQILKTHSESENHILAYKFMNNKIVDTIDKSEKENLKTSTDNPDFINKTDWDEMIKEFPWLYFKQSLFRCIVCEEGYEKEKNLLSSTQWTCPDPTKGLRNSFQKTLPNFSRFEKHQQSQNHIKAFEIINKGIIYKDIDRNSLKGDSVKNKDEFKLMSITKKSPVISSPNVTTRTAVRKSVIDYNVMYNETDEDLWNECQKEYPWAYAIKNVIHCSFCEEAYKTHSEKMTATNWTSPDTITDQNALTVDKLKSKSRLNRHESTKNHEIAVKLMSSPLSKSNTSPRRVSAPIKKDSKAKESNQSNTTSLLSSNNFRLPQTVRASRKSAPMKLSNLSYNEKITASVRKFNNTGLKPFLSSSTPYSTRYKTQNNEDRTLFNAKDQFLSEKEIFLSLSAFLTKSQFNYIKSHYSWLYTKTGSSYGCRICLEASKITKLPLLLKDPLVSGEEKFQTKTDYFHFRKKLFQHEESKIHTDACEAMGSNDSHHLTSVSVTTNSPKDSNTRFTRLKSGECFKVDYKRMSEGYLEVDDEAHQLSTSHLSTRRRQPISQNWTCPQCKSLFSKTGDLIQHINLCDYQPVEMTTEHGIGCPCNPSVYRFNTITKLDLHVAQEHDNHSYFHCYICSDRYNRLSILYNHMLIHHLISWDPFEAYRPVKSLDDEQHRCVFCSEQHITNMLLTKHYCQSECNSFLDVTVLLQDISSFPVPSSDTFQKSVLSQKNISQCPSVHEEVTILDVDELPEEKEIVYSPSPVKQSTRNQHHNKANNRINRKYSLRRISSGTVSMGYIGVNGTETGNSIINSSTISSEAELIDKVKDDILHQPKQLEIRLVSLDSSNMETCNFEIIDLKVESPNKHQIDKPTDTDGTDIDYNKDDIGSKENGNEINLGNKSLDQNIDKISEETSEKHDNIQKDLSQNIVEIVNDNDSIEKVNVTSVAVEIVAEESKIKEIDCEKEVAESKIISNNNQLETDIDSIVDSIINKSEICESTENSQNNINNSGILNDSGANLILSSSETTTTTIKTRKKRMSKKMKMELQQQASMNNESVMSDNVLTKTRKYIRRNEKNFPASEQSLLLSQELKKSSNLIEVAKVVDLNDIIKETEINNKSIGISEARKQVPFSITMAIDRSNKTSAITGASSSFVSSVGAVIGSTMKPSKKLSIQIQSQLSPCKKLKTIDRPLPDTPSISFMDRMKKIRQLKKYRSEQQREHMMAVDRKLAEINEKCRTDSMADKSDLIRKLFHDSEHGSRREYLKTIIQLDSKPVRAEKRKLSHNAAESKTTSAANMGSSIKQFKIDFAKPPAPPPTTSVTTSTSTSTTSTNNSPSAKPFEIFPCDVCQLKFKSLRARDNHTTSDHKGLKLFSCRSCQLSFTTHILLRKHAQKYHADNVSMAVFGSSQDNSTEVNFAYRCSFCPQQFTSRSGLNHHITSSHKPETTENSFTSLALDEFVTKLTEADPTYSPQCCLICQEVLDNEFELEIHTIEHEREISENKPAQFACPKCCRMFFGRDGKSYLKDHYHIVHLEKPAPVCDECNTKFSSTICFNYHRRTVKNCSKRLEKDNLKIDDPYEKLNESMKLAFVCNRCQALVAGESAESRFQQHQAACNSSSVNDDSLIGDVSHQTDCLDGQ